MRPIDADNVRSILDLSIALAKMNMRMLGAEDDESLQAILEAYREVRDAIKERPTIDVEPKRKRGKWIVRKFSSDAMCSECGMYFKDVYDMDNYDKYCRHCGTEMEGLKVTKDG